jgi:hypothetical protein
MLFDMLDVPVFGREEVAANENASFWMPRETLFMLTNSSLPFMSLF